MNWKKLASLGVVAMMSLSILGCGSDTASNDKAASSSSLSGSITGSGSSALLPLAKDAADKFKELHPEVSITLNGGGSGTGLKQVADGSVDIGNLLDLAALLLVGVHLQQEKLPVQAVLPVHYHDALYNLKLFCLGYNLLHGTLRSAEHYGYSRKGRIVGRRHRKRVDVEASPSEHAYNSVKNVRLVQYEDAHYFFFKRYIHIAILLIL